MKINEISKRLNISAHTIRYYEKVGLISPKRNENKYREYSGEDEFNLVFIQVLQYAEFSLAEIKEIIDSFYLPPSDECNIRINKLFINKTNELTSKIENYKTILGLLKEVPLAKTAKEYEEKIDYFKSSTLSMVLELYKKISGESK